MLEDGETMPDVRLLFRLMGRLAERELEAVHDADGDHWQAGLRLLTLQQRCRERPDRAASLLREARQELLARSAAQKGSAA